LAGLISGNAGKPSGTALLELLHFEDVVWPLNVGFSMHGHGGVTVWRQNQAEDPTSSWVIPILQVAHAVFVLNRQIARMSFRDISGCYTSRNNVAI